LHKQTEFAWSFGSRPLQVGSSRALVNQRDGIPGRNVCECSSDAGAQLFRCGEPPRSRDDRKRSTAKEATRRESLRQIRKHRAAISRAATLRL
jgi:hypothetical protein